MFFVSLTNKCIFCLFYIYFLDVIYQQKKLNIIRINNIHVNALAQINIIASVNRVIDQFICKKDK